MHMRRNLSRAHKYIRKYINPTFHAYTDDNFTREIKEIRDSFDTGYYLSKNPEVAAAGVDPVEHFVRYGWKEGRDPNDEFSTRGYLKNNPDIAATGQNPFWHFVVTGKEEGRVSTISFESEASECDGPEAQEIAAIRDSFDTGYYLSKNPEVAAAGVDPVEHYVRYGWKEGRDPNNEFSTRGYLKNNPDIAAAGLNPFWHFVVVGKAEGRISKPKVTGANASADPDDLISYDNHFFGVDTTLMISDVGVFVKGWSLGLGNGRRDLLVVVNDVLQGDILGTAFRFPRPDLAMAFGAKFADNVEEAGFAAFLPLDGMEFSPGKMRLEALYDGLMTHHTTPTTTALPSSRAAAVELLKFPFVERKGMMAYLANHLAPAISRISYTRSVEITAEEVSYGTQPETPRLSIVVPLYGRFDFMETQLALFADDSDFMTDIELIYVVDDPRMERAIRMSAVMYEQFFGVPFKVLYYDKNLGYAGANNVGARAARAEHMLLLNSDVFPSAPGWCSRMLERFASLPDCGALGTRLLFADGSLQHDGMQHIQAGFLEGLYICDHPGKGGPAMPVTGMTSSAEVPCATGACLMVRRDDYEAVGGFDEGFLIGDFEDSDLCLALVEKGRKIYVARDIELYHLERQSQSILSDTTGWKHQLTIYNCWRHQNKWNHVLSQTKEWI